MSLGKEKRASIFGKRLCGRIERERKQTIKGLIAVRNREKIREETEAGSQAVDDDQNKETSPAKREELGQLTEKSKEIVTKQHYEYTELSKLKMFVWKKEAERSDKILYDYKRRKFLASVAELKGSLLNEKWNHFCHSKQRAIERENNRLQNILRIKWKYKMTEILPHDSHVFDKIVRYKRERRKEAMTRRERMIRIIDKINREMDHDVFKRAKHIKISKSVKYLRKSEIDEADEESSKISGKADEEDFEKERKIVEEDPSIILHLQEKEAVSEIMEKEAVPEILEKGIKIESWKEDTFLNVKKYFGIMEDVNELPEDFCFYANPNIVVFDNFEVNKIYNRKVTITNKSQKWAYLRYYKMDTKIWEPSVIEIDPIEAAKIPPGLHLTINVKFSPVSEENISSDVCFLTLSPDDPETFHQFRVPIRCTPDNPLPLVDPKEIRFPSAPIWKFKDPKLNERNLVISNDGGKAFSFLIAERNYRDDCFLWNFEDGEPQTAKSSTVNVSGEDEQVENDEEESTSDASTSRKKYEIEVPGKFRCRLKISFYPRYIGLHHETFDISFLTGGKVFNEQTIPIWAEVTGPQIHLNPPCIDLGIVIVDSDVCQQNFDIVNTGRLCAEVFVKTPRRLGRQVEVHPKSVTIQSEAFCTVSVRLIPESSILKLSKKYYNATMNLLEFPIHVQIASRDAEKPPPIVLKVLANPTTCRGLILEPALVDLDVIHTNESVFVELNLTNESLVIQEYGFPNLPTFFEIQPNYGFGRILPGETIKLHMIYSAWLTDIPGNEVGANGLSGDRSFQIQVFTLAELAGSKKRINIDDIKNLQDERPLFQQNFQPLISMPVRTTMPEVNVRNDHEQYLGNPNDYTDSDSSVDEKDAEKVSVSTSVTKEATELPKRKRTDKNIIEIQAHIVDTFCELSEQIVEFPATPCGCFSIVSLDLRGFNMASHSNCTCGILKNQEKEFTARYEFHCSSERVKVAPQRGLLRSNDLVKVTFIFKPKLSKNVILERARELRAQRIAEETKASEISEGDKSMGMKEKRWRKKEKRVEKEKASQEGETSAVDKLPGEISLLETFEPRVATIFATCKIEVECSDGTRRNEHLLAKFICPITRPEILILNADREVTFEPTAIGASSRQFLLVKNISSGNVKVDVSLLNPFGPFFMTPGKTIETGTILKLPITYKPEGNHEGKIQEYFRVSSPKTRTIWQVKVTGSGVVPSWIISPQIQVARFNLTGDEKQVELKMSIQNTGMCPLTFGLLIVDMSKGNIPRAEEEEAGEKVKKNDGKRKKMGIDGKENRGKTSRKLEFSDALYEHEKLAIFGGKFERLENRECFAFRNFDENMQLHVRENGKREFVVEFQPPWRKEKKGETKEKRRVRRMEKSKKGLSEKEDDSTREAKESLKSKDSQSIDEKKSNYSYVALFKLMLGTSTFVQDLIMICSME